MKKIKEFIPAFCLNSVLAYFFAKIFLSHLSFLGRGDWDYFCSMHEVIIQSIFKYHQFPFWNPYNSGGLPLFANPQGSFPSITGLCAMVFGTIAGLKVAVVLLVFIGLWGMFLLSRHLGMSGLSVFFSGLIFVYSGAFVLHIIEGHLTWLSILLVPWAMYFFLRAVDQKVYVLFSALMVVLMFFDGGLYAFSFYMMFIFLYSLFRSIQLKKYMLLGLCFFKMFIVFVLIAPKLLPLMEFVGRFPRLTSSGGFFPINALFDFFVNPCQSFFQNSLYGSAGWWEMGAYIGYVAVLFYLFSFTLIKQHWSLLLISLIFLTMSLGNFCVLSPWSIFHRLPLYNCLQVPSRVHLFFIFIISLLVGLYIDKLVKDLKGSVFIKLLICLAFVYVFHDLSTVNMSQLNSSFTPFRVDLKEQISLFHIDKKNPAEFVHIYQTDDEMYGYGAWSAMFLNVAGNLGVVNGYEPLPVQGNVLGVNESVYQGEQYLLGKQGSVSLKSWSPNRLVYEVHVQNPDTLIINQNFDPNWKSTDHSQVVSYKHLLSFPVFPNKKIYEIYYFPQSFLWGIVIFLLGGVLIFILMRGTGFPVLFK